MSILWGFSGDFLGDLGDFGGIFVGIWGRGFDFLGGFVGIWAPELKMANFPLEEEMLDSQGVILGLKSSAGWDREPKSGGNFVTKGESLGRKKCKKMRGSGWGFLNKYRDCRDSV